MPAEHSPGQCRYEPAHIATTKTTDDVPPTSEPLRWTFTAPGGDVLSLLATVADGENGPVATLAHDYSDVQIVAGWFVSRKGRTLVVTGVDGRILTCEEKG